MTEIRRRTFLFGLMAAAFAPGQVENAIAALRREWPDLVDPIIEPVYPDREKWWARSYSHFNVSSTSNAITSPLSGRAKVMQSNQTLLMIPFGSYGMGRWDAPPDSEIVALPDRLLRIEIEGDVHDVTIQVMYQEHLTKAQFTGDEMIKDLSWQADVIAYGKAMDQWYDEGENGLPPDEKDFPGEYVEFKRPFRGLIYYETHHYPLVGLPKLQVQLMARF